MNRLRAYLLLLLNAVVWTITFMVAIPVMAYYSLVRLFKRVFVKAK